MIRERIVIDQAEYKRLLAAAKDSSNSSKNETKSDETPATKSEHKIDLVDDHNISPLLQILKPLNPKMFIKAKIIMTSIIETDRFNYILSTGEIMIDDKIIKNSNLLDLLNFLFKHPSPQCVNLSGLHEFIYLLASTHIPSYLLDNSDARKIFVEQKIV